MIAIPACNEIAIALKPKTLALVLKSNSKNQL
jgi:hypothetical protein